jgi:hypothetical protein
MGENNYETEKRFWTKHSSEVAVALARKLQQVAGVLVNNPVCVGSDEYVMLKNLEPDVDELYDRVIHG